ncbi:MAG: LuxR C-terminal-related transcriptional regulator [Anaerolineales bacterium]|nr:LuxR C-terminal-related transcriptional regulator [Anaerolineales bacterium]
MSDSLLSTKIHIPPLHGNMVNRENLVGRLNEGIARDCRLTLISAPAGYGKSTLLSEWQSQANFPVAWLSLEREENTPERFWSYLVAALHTVPQIQQTNRDDAIFRALRTSQSGSMEPLLTELVNQLSALEERVALVLDDLHVLSESQLHQDLIYLIEHLPCATRGLHLVAASRMDPPWPLARWRARAELNELRAADLRFTSAETGQFFDQTLQHKLSLQEIATLQERTEGWIAGLQMAAISMQGRLKAQGLEGVSHFIETFSGSHRFILDYLVDEVINQQSAETRTFLYDTSILDQLTAPLCDALIDRPGSQAVLDQLERANLFLSPLDEERRWYRYHHLFAELLRKQSKQIGSNEHIACLHQRASAWYAENNLPAEAVYHALNAGDVTRANQILARNVLAMVENMGVLDVLRHFEDLPAHQISSNPWLCVAYAWVKAYADPCANMNDILQQAEHGLEGIEENAEKKHLSSHLSAIRAYLAWMRGDAAQALEFTQHALENLPAQDWTAHTHLLNIEGLARQHQGDLSGATQAFQSAIAAGEKIGRIHETLHTYTNLAFAHLLQGHLQNAFSLCQAALAMAEKSSQSGKRMPVLAYAHATQSIILLEWNSLDAAVASARQGVALAEQWRQADALHFALNCLSQALGAAGALEEAFAVNQQALQLAKDISPWYTQISTANEIGLFLAKGDTPAAARKVAELEPGLGGSQSKDLLLVEFSLLYAQKRYLDVINTLAGALGDLKQEGWNHFWLKILVIQALALQALNRQEDALDVLEQCLAAAEPGGYVRIFVERDVPMARLLKIARSRGAYPEYTSKLLDAFQLPEDSFKPEKPAPPVTRAAGVNLVEPLSQRELEVLRYLNSPQDIPEIAREMRLAPSTLRTHVRNIYLKLDVHGRLEALQKARDLGLF